MKAIASGNPLVIEKASVDAEVLRLTRLKRQHADSQYQMRCRIKSLGESLQTTERHITEITADLNTRTSTARDAFVMTIQGATFTHTKPLGSIAGFTFTLHRLEAKTTLSLQGQHSYQSNVTESPVGTIASLEHVLTTIPEILADREASHRLQTKQREDLTKQIGIPFEHDTRLTDATRRQQEIITALDITKNQAAASVGEVNEGVISTTQKTASQQSVGVG